MKIKRYGGKYAQITKLLMEKGVLETYPRQVDRTDLEYDEGIDIVFRLRNMTPAKFKEYSEALLLAAYTEAERYKEEKYKFAKFEVQLNRNPKGRKTGISPRRDYIAAKHPDSETMVYGEEALGYTIPEGMRKPFLVNKIEEILNIPDTPSPGAFVNKQRPYKVVSMVVSIRAGLSEGVGKKEKKEEGKEEKKK